MSPKIDNHLLSLIISDHAQDSDLDSFLPMDWDLLVHLAQAEGVASLLYWKLSQSEKINLLPEVLQKSLRALYFSVRMKNEATLTELETLTQLFDQAGIPVVALKGICFLLTIYPDLGLRPMADLDLLVPDLKLTEAVRIAKSLGYVEAIPEASPGLEDLLNHALCLRKIVSPFTTLEIHHSLVADKSFIYAVPVDWFWNQTELMDELASMNNLRMLSPTAQVLYASAHAMLQHGGRQTSLRWFYDLDLLVRFYTERMDWDLLLSQARTFEWSSAVSAALSQTVAFFGTPVPKKVLDDLSKHLDRNTKLVASLQNQPATHTLEEAQKMMSLNGRGRFRLILALIVPSPAYMRWRYQLKTYWTLPVYYLFRWWGIFIDMIRTAIVLIETSLHKSRVDTPDYKSW